MSEECPDYDELKNAVLFLSGFAMASPNLGPESTVYYCKLCERLGVTSPIMRAHLAKAEAELKAGAQHGKG